MIEERAYRTEKGFWCYGNVAEEETETASRVGIGTLENYQEPCVYFGRERVIPLYLGVAAEERLLHGFRREKKEAEPCYPKLTRRFQADKAGYMKGELSAVGIRKRYENPDLERCLGKLYEAVLQYAWF